MIHVRGLSVEYGPVRALASVTLDFRRGETTVLLGRSGAGKSTLLRCLNHLQVPTHGSVQVEGLGPLTNARNLREHRRRTGMIFQAHQLIGRQAALHNVLAGRLGHHSALRTLLPLPKPDVRRALGCLERVGLLGKALARADQLSGGERQRVGIARALCQDPTLILADEPVASLDPATAEEVMALLCRTCLEQGVTLILSLHQLDFARRFGRRIVGLAAGRVVFDGPPAALSEDSLRAIYPNLEPALVTVPVPHAAGSNDGGPETPGKADHEPSQLV